MDMNTEKGRIYGLFQDAISLFTKQQKDSIKRDSNSAMGGILPQRHAQTNPISHTISV
jgi:hypothetical protein